MPPVGRYRYRRRRDEPVRGQQHRRGRLGGQPGQPHQVGELLRTKRRAGLAEQTRHRQHGLHQAAQPGIVAVPGGDALRLLDRVGAAAAHLVGARQDADRVDRGGVAELRVGQHLKEVHVGGVQLAQQVHHRVDAVRVGGPVGVAGEELLRLPGHRLRQRPHARRVDQGHPGQPGAGYLDAQLVQVVGAQVAEVQHERGAARFQAQRPGLGVARVGAGRRVLAVRVPGHHAGALARVGRRDPLPDQGVEQRRLAGLDPAGDRHPQRLVHVPGDGEQAALGRAAPVRGDGLGEQRTCPVGEGHRGRTPRTRPASSSRVVTRARSVAVWLARCCALDRSACTARTVAACSACAVIASSVARSR